MENATLGVRGWGGLHCTCTKWLHALKYEILSFKKITYRDNRNKGDQEWQELHCSWEGSWRATAIHVKQKQASNQRRDRQSDLKSDSCALYKQTCLFDTGIRDLCVLCWENVQVVFLEFEDLTQFSPNYPINGRQKYNSRALHDPPVLRSMTPLRFDWVVTTRTQPARNHFFYAFILHPPSQGCQVPRRQIVTVHSLFVPRRQIAREQWL